MTVKSVLRLSAANMGREDLASAVCDCNESPAGECASLLRCYNLVENEMALDYFPLKAEESFENVEGVLPFSRFQKAPVEILSIVDGEGRRVSFEIRPARLVFAPGERKKVTISYNYSPAEKGFTDECEVDKNVSARLLSFGVVCEFLLSHGQFAEAATWEKKFREAIRAAATRRRPILIRARRWA